MTLSETFADIRQKIAARRLRVAVLGDTITDEWVAGEVVKVEQGGAAPVFCQERVFRLPGGAGNVARQLEHANTLPVLISLPGAPPLKRRFCTADGRVLFRHDDEAGDYGMGHAEAVSRARAACLGRLRRLILEDGLDAVIISDYGKGTLDDQTVARALLMCRDAGIISVVDPWIGRSPAAYQGCSCFKPNAYYCETWEPQLRPQVMTDGPCEPIWDDAVIPNGHGCDERPPVPCVNPVGAGDAFAAWLAVALTHGFPLPDAAEWAYSAGRVYVQRAFAEPVLPSEILTDIDPAAAKVIDAASLATLLRLRHEGRRVIVANGCFRLGVHAGHAEMLSWAKAQGDVLVAAVNSDASVRRLKPGAVVLPLAERMTCLAALASVDHVVSFDEDTPEVLLEALAPHVTAVVKGPDYEGRSVASARLPVLLAPPGRFACRHASLPTST